MGGRSAGRRPLAAALVAAALLPRRALVGRRPVVAMVGGGSEVVVHPCQCSFVASPPCYVYACGRIKRMLCRYRRLGGSLAAVVAS